MLQQENQRGFEKELKMTDAEAKYLVQCTCLQAQASTDSGNTTSQMKSDPKVCRPNMRHRE